MTGIVASGLLLGLLSSFHCVGMCGPLALSVPVLQEKPWQKWLSVFLYHGGRLLTYTSLGLLFGFAGRRFYMAGFQQWLSIVLGILILLFAVPAILRIPTRPGNAVNRLFAGLQPLMYRYLKLGSLSGVFMLGILNGLLPCGMVYLAIAGALSSSGVWQGAGFMFFFGTGTVPALLALRAAGFRAGPSLRSGMRRMVPYVMGFMGAMLIIRGMNLGIPFLSPLMDSPTPDAVICH